MSKGNKYRNNRNNKKTKKNLSKDKLKYYDNYGDFYTRKKVKTLYDDE